jgi:hypothetical protein
MINYTNSFNQYKKILSLLILSICCTIVIQNKIAAAGDPITRPKKIPGIAKELPTAQLPTATLKKAKLKPKKFQPIHIDSEPYLILISPKKNDKLQYNRDIDIRWESARISDFLNIYLYKSGRDLGRICQIAPGRHHYLWKPGMRFESGLCGNGFEIHLEQNYTNTPLADSGIFSILLLEITEPAGEIWHINEQKDIVWNMNGFRGTISLELLNKDGEKIGQIAKMAYANNGRYHWQRVGHYNNGSLTGEQIGAEYKIKIYSDGNLLGKLSSTSHCFTITQ